MICKFDDIVTKEFFIKNLKSGEHLYKVEI